MTVPTCSLVGATARVSGNARPGWSNAEWPVFCDSASAAATARRYSRTTSFEGPNMRTRPPSMSMLIVDNSPSHSFTATTALPLT